MGDRTLGLLLFLPVPLALLLFTRFPLGPGPSLALGIGLVLSHRFYARPFALDRAARRCLWCGRSAGHDSPRIAVHEPGGVTSWRACGPAHARRAASFFAWMDQWRRPVQAGILGSLLAYLAMTLARLTGPSLPWSLGDAVAVFQAGVALTVLPVGWIATLGKGALPGDPPRAPFPVHIQSLVGTMGVLWLFRLVGLAWLIMAVVHFTTRVPLTS